MPYGYIGQNLPNQTKSNSGVFSISDVADLEKQGKFGGSLELIEEQTYSGAVANIDFLAIQENKYNVHCLQFSNIQGDGTAGSDLSIRFYETGVLETASVYQYAFQYGGATGTFGEFKSTSDTSIFSIAGNFQNNIANGYVYFYNLGNSSKYSFCTFQSYTGHPTQSAIMKFGGGVLPQASVVDGIRLFIDTGENFTAFNIKLYGVKQL
jgi:hypothetical protein